VTLIACVALAACDGGGAAPVVDDGVQTLSPGELPTSSPGAATGTLSVGTASISVTGDTNASVSFASLGPTVVYAPGAAMNVTWRSPADPNASLTLSGPAAPATAPTSAELRLAFALTVEGEPVMFQSSSGECSVTVNDAAEHTLAGTFNCAGVEAGGYTVNATGTFLASG
jgi:hypothetical protein